MSATPSPTAAPTPHRWRFFRAGGFDQVRLDSGADLLHLDQLDQKLWVALSCPVKGLEFDARTLALLDADADGHIRAPDLIAALKWAGSLLRDPDLLAAGADPLLLAAIDDTHDEGRRLLASAREIVKNLGKADTTDTTDAATLSADDTADSARIFASTRFNGDGIVTAASTDDATLQALIGEIGDCCGTRTDRSGEPGIGQAELDTFFADAEAYVAWLTQPRSDSALLPLGAATEAAHAALETVRAKVDDWFARCRLAAFDPRAADAMNGTADDFRALATRNLATPGDDMAALPIAFVAADRPLPLATGTNPAWAGALAALAADAVAPLLGERTELDAAEWNALCARLAPYRDWCAARPESPATQLDAARLETIVGEGMKARLESLIAQDEALAEQAAAIDAVDRLVRYVRDLGRLANNFVAFRDFYASDNKAVFQAGTLYLDGRSCDLVVHVLDAARHATLATLSGVYLVYCDCVRGSEKTSIAAAFTAGDADQLLAGRNGVFYDRQGRDWDATITRIVDHPISIRQAFWSPYKKVVRLAAEQFQKFAAAKAKASDDLLAAKLADTAKKAEAAKAGPPAAPATPPAPFDVAKFAGIFAAIGLAVGALGTALAAVVTGFLGLKLWQMPIAIGGIMLLISGPAMAMAWFKLRNRNLAPILDANGWAVNARARINIPFGTSLTQLAKLPANAERALTDPYADKPTPWGLYTFVLVLALVLLVWATRTAGGG